METNPQSVPIGSSEPLPTGDHSVPWSFCKQLLERQTHLERQLMELQVRYQNDVIRVRQESAAYQRDDRADRLESNAQ